MPEIYIAESTIFDNYCVIKAKNLEEAKQEAGKIFGNGAYVLNTIRSSEANPNIFFPREC